MMSLLWKWPSNSSRSCCMDKISCAFCHLASCKMFKASPAKTVMKEFFFHLLSRIFVHLLSRQIRCALSSSGLLSQIMGFPLLSNASSNASMTHGHLPTNRCSPAHCTQLVSAIQAAVQKELPAVSWTYIPRPMPPFPDIWQLKVTLILLQVLMLNINGQQPTLFQYHGLQCQLCGHKQPNWLFCFWL